MSNIQHSLCECNIRANFEKSLLLQYQTRHDINIKVFSVIRLTQYQISPITDNNNKNSFK
jgi:hypothetical protein